MASKSGGLISVWLCAAGEVYEVEMSEVDNLIVKYIGGMMVSLVISQYSAIQGKDANTALGYGLIYPLIQLVQGALNDDSAKFGQEGPIKYLNLLITSVVTYTLLQGGPLDQALTCKVYAGWCALNGLFAYFAPDKMLEAWGADSKSVNPVFLKFMGLSIAAIGATFWLLTTGESAIKTLGMTTALYLAAMIDGNFITKDAPGSKNAQYFWIVINAAVCYFTLS